MSGRNQPTTIFMGSSRIKQSIDPKVVAGTEFAPAYNGGINGSANFDETQAYLQNYLQGRQEFASCLHRGIRACAVRQSSATRNRDHLWPPASRPETVSRRIRTCATTCRFRLDILLGERLELRDSHRVDESATNPHAGSSDDGFAPFPLRRIISASETFSILCCTPASWGAAARSSWVPLQRQEK